MWREENAWSIEHELLATIAETIDGWGRNQTYVTRLAQVKNPQQLPFPPSLVDLSNEARDHKRELFKEIAAARKQAVEPAPERDENGRAPIRIDPAAARRFFGTGGIRPRG